MTALLWIVLLAVLVAVTCALAGIYLQLGGRPLMGDALAHGVLPGIAVAFLWSGSRDTLLFLPFAALVALALVWLTERTGGRGRLREDAGMGIVYTVFFSIGVILISAYAGDMELDLDCVLYGELIYTPWQRWTWAGVDLGPRAFWMLLLALVVQVGMLLGMKKELTLMSFDAGYAGVMGVPTRALYYVHMGGVALTTIAAFEVVGAILVVALLIVPVATARLLSRSVGQMMVLSVGVAILTALCGIGLAMWVDTSIAGAMAVASGVMFVGVAVIGDR
jgi:manganese/zinc/iron transport system permease protein